MGQGSHTCLVLTVIWYLDAESGASYWKCSFGLSGDGAQEGSIVFNTHSRWFLMIKPFKTYCSLGTLSVEAGSLVKLPRFPPVSVSWLRWFKTPTGILWKVLFLIPQPFQESVESIFLQLHTCVRLNCLPKVTSQQKQTWDSSCLLLNRTLRDLQTCKQCHFSCWFFENVVCFFFS